MPSLLSSATATSPERGGRRMHAPYHANRFSPPPSSSSTPSCRPHDLISTTSVGGKLYIPRFTHWFWVSLVCTTGKRVICCVHNLGHTANLLFAMCRPKYTQQIQSTRQTQHLSCAKGNNARQTRGTRQIYITGLPSCA